MSGMPAWQFHLSEADLWSVVAFMGVLPAMSARDYAQATGAPVPAPAAVPAGASR
jgi:mono/diheme cytochrome c family protein